MTVTAPGSPGPHSRTGPTALGSSGFSLVELMVAITLGLLLTAGMVQLFTSTRVTFNTNQALARVQENGRFAMELLKRELRPVSSRGFCAGRLEITNHLNEGCSEFPSGIFLGDVGVTGWEFDGTGRSDEFSLPDSLVPGDTARGKWSSNEGDSLPTILENRAAPGSDILVVRRFSPSGVSVDENKNNTQIDLEGFKDCFSPDCRNPEPGDIVLITNCASGADLFQQSKAQSLSAGLRKPTMNCSSAGPGNKPPGPNPWSTEYDESAQVFFVTQTAYFIGFRGDDREQPGLYQLDLARNQATELVEGVESMQVLYGFSNDGASGGDGQSVDFWRTADEIPADGWRQVIALRVSLLMRSPDPADADATEQTYALFSDDPSLELTLTANGDGRLRQPFSTAVALRNQQLVIE